MQIKNRYSLLQKIRLGWWVIRTKFICAKARLIRFPLDLRGGVFVDWGKSLTTGRYCRIEAFSSGVDKKKRIVFGDNVQINDYVHISAIEHVSIGNSVLIASHVYISDNSHGSYKGDEHDSDPRIEPAKRSYFISPVNIGDNTWIGEGVIILPGANIGKGCVVGAHTVVKSGRYPDYSIIVGSPARIVKRYNQDSGHWEKVNN